MFSPTVLGTGTGGYAYLTRTREVQQGLFAKSSEVARDTRHFADRLKDVESSDQLVNDRALLKVALGAFGLEDDLNNRAFIKKILDSDLTDSTSLANRLADKQYLALARAFNFAGDGGPSMSGFKTGNDVSRDLAAVASADDLLGDADLLRATLKTFGLEKDVGNTFFLKSVLESDLANPESFVNRLSDPRYGDLARAFDLGAKTRAQDSIYGLAQRFSGVAASVGTVAELFANPDLLNASLKIFGLEGDTARIGFLQSVLSSDLGDPTSAANAQDDPRYAALAGVFGFAERAATEAAGGAFTSKLENLIEKVSAVTTPAETAEDFFKNPRLMLAVFDFFDLPARSDSAQFANRILTSDRDSATSLINVFPDPRYRAFADALGLQDQATERTYPAGFADAIVGNYLDRQFEIRIGERDPTMRFALAMERDLGRIIDTGTSNNARWFGVMASGPLREVFETVFQLPDSFGTLDIDRQLGDLKSRAQRFFGTSELADFVGPDLIEDLRQRYLLRSQFETNTSSTSSGNIVLALLGGG